MKTPTLLSSLPLLCAGLMLAFAACAEVPPSSQADTAPTRPKKAPLVSGVIDTNQIRSVATSSGSHKTVFNGPTATLLNFESHITTVNPRQSAHTPHSHPHEELLVVKEGTLEVTINGKTERAGPGAVIFYSANDPHATKSVGDVPAVYYVFTWVTDKTKQPDVTKPYAPAQ